ncbi:MAG: fluoride efflux transporter CrcB [Deltaproteobacteria bacterium]|jgi:CrcB protein|nr:fluoride efflux transporter CrcB [Deltaproteobacteria bacterium]
MQIQLLIAVLIGGGIGSVFRYSLCLLFNRLTPPFPLGILISNVIAGIICGFIVAYQKETNFLSPKMALFLTTGMMGGLSTFSTFSVDTVLLLKDTKYFLAGTNIIANLALSLLGALLGIFLAHRIHSMG